MTSSLLFRQLLLISLVITLWILNYGLYSYCNTFVPVATYENESIPLWEIFISLPGRYLQAIPNLIIFTVIRRVTPILKMFVFYSIYKFDLTTTPCKVVRHLTARRATIKNKNKIVVDKLIVSSYYHDHGADVMHKNYLGLIKFMTSRDLV